MLIGRNCVKNHQFRPIEYMNWAELSKKDTNFAHINA